MNFCTKCASYYQQPGTCNCYAFSVVVDPARLPAPGGTVPFPQHPHDMTVAHQPSPYQFPTTCDTVRYDPTVPFTHTNENSFEEAN